METLENIQTHYYINSVIEEDFGANQNLIDITRKKINRISDNLDSYFFYSLKIQKCVTRKNYHQFTMNDIQDISRKFTNGMTSIGTIPNRVFFKKYFYGGVRTISVSQSSTFDFPVYTINFLLFSSSDNLDVRIKNQILLRLKRLDPTVDVDFNFLGKYKDVDLLKYLDTSVNVDFNSEPILKLGEENTSDIFNNQFQRPVFYGTLFKFKKDEDNSINRPNKKSCK